MVNSYKQCKRGLVDLYKLTEPVTVAKLNPRGSEDVTVALRLSSVTKVPASTNAADLVETLPLGSPKLIFPGISIFPGLVMDKAFVEPFVMVLFTVPLDK